MGGLALREDAVEPLLPTKPDPGGKGPPYCVVWRLHRNVAFDEPPVRCEMIFFTTFVTLTQHQHEGTERRRGSPARVEGNTIRLPIGTEVQVGTYVEYRPPNDKPRMMVVIDVIHPSMPGVSAVDDHIEVTCVPIGRVAIPEVTMPVLHPTMSTTLALVEDGRLSDAVLEALRLVEERVQSLTESDSSGHTLMESVFDTTPPQLDVTTTTGPAAEAERDGFRFLFIGAMLGLQEPYRTARTVATTLDETLEYLAVASMLMRRLDRAENRLD